MPFLWRRDTSNCKEMQALRRMVGRLSFQYKKSSRYRSVLSKGFKTEVNHLKTPISDFVLILFWTGVIATFISMSHQSGVCHLTNPHKWLQIMQWATYIPEWVADLLSGLVDIIFAYALYIGMKQQTHERLINYQYYNHCSSNFFDFMYGFNLYCRRRLHWNTYLSFCYIRYAYYINHNWSPIYPTLQRTIK